jgi:hypothetical protein
LFSSTVSLFAQKKKKQKQKQKQKQKNKKSKTKNCGNYDFIRDYKKVQFD